MLLSDFDYHLPEELIAQEPATPRDHSRLLVVERGKSSVRHERFFSLPEFLRPGDLLIRNDSKVLPARLHASLLTGGKLEILLLSQRGESNTIWNCLVRPGRKIKDDTRVKFKDGERATLRRTAEAFEIEFHVPADRFLDFLNRVGRMPLPPYIRQLNPTDCERYQTVYAREGGSVAAPTAGLHFTTNLFEALRARGVSVADVTLHVGYGTFAPIRTESILEHKMHEEYFEIPETTRSLIAETKRNGGRVIAVGTTSMRAIESVAANKFTRLFISPGYEFKIADGLITNFHLPKTSLLVLVSTFLGVDETRRIYGEAIREKYRFFSYGDAMVIL